MKCKRCGVEGKPSKAILLVLDRNPDYPNICWQGVYRGRVELTDCLKCPDCGSSWTQPNTMNNLEKLKKALKEHEEDLAQLQEPLKVKEAVIKQLREEIREEEQKTPEYRQMMKLEKLQKEVEELKSVCNSLKNRLSVAEHALLNRDNRRLPFIGPEVLY